MTLFDKLWDRHLVCRLDSGEDLIAIDRVFLHERTGGVALASLAERNLPILDPGRVYCTMDHIVSTLPGRGADDARMPGGETFITETRRQARRAGINLIDVNDPRQGIVHVVAPELGIVQPGMTLVCPDSHTCSLGALGALAWGIGSSEAEHAMATGTLRLTKPKNMRITIDGTLARGVTAKDLVLHIIARIGVGAGKGYAVEYAGSTIAAMDVEARLTLCNMAVEYAAFTAVIAPDGVTQSYLEGRPHAPTGALWEQACADWMSLRSDSDAGYDVEYHFQAEDVLPMVTWGISPEQAIPADGTIPAIDSLPPDKRESARRACEYMGVRPGMPLAGLPISGVFIGSCTNARLSDLRAAAAVLRGHRVAPGIRAICVPGSQTVKRAAEKDGLDQVFIDAGFEWREPGCAMCFYAGGEHMGEGARVASTTNRNFESRQGPRTRTHLMSPAMAAAAAITGTLVDGRALTEVSS